MKRGKPGGFDAFVKNIIFEKRNKDDKKGTSKSNNKGENRAGAE